jgi:ComF family protein
MLKTLTDALLTVVFPQQCALCKGEVEFVSDGIVCSDCWNSTKIFTGTETLCSKCGAFLFSSVSSSLSRRCGKCEDHAYDAALASGLYHKALAASIVHLKRQPRLSPRIKTLLRMTLDKMAPDDSTLIMPIPLSARRFQERGFNQASIIGKFLSKTSGLEFDESSFVRLVHTPMHRAGMDKKARAVTVKNAFSVVRPKLVEGRSILLVDDVLTSGATVSTCAAELKKKGVSTVHVLTIARAL